MLAWIPHSVGLPVLLRTVFNLSWSVGPGSTVPPALPGLYMLTQLKEQWSQQSSWACRSHSYRYSSIFHRCVEAVGGTDSASKTWSKMLKNHLFSLAFHIQNQIHALFKLYSFVVYTNWCACATNVLGLTGCIQRCQSECFLWYDFFILLAGGREWFTWAASGLKRQACYPNMADRFIWTHWRGMNLPAEAVSESGVRALFTLMVL